MHIYIYTIHIHMLLRVLHSPFYLGMMMMIMIITTIIIFIIVVIVTCISLHNGVFYYVDSKAHKYPLVPFFSFLGTSRSGSPVLR